VHGAGDASTLRMGKWLMLLAMASGCAHYRGDVERTASTLIVATIIAAEIAASEPPPRGPLCADDETDPPHTCPGTTPAPPEQ
jgi:hypothetical protein